MDAMNATPNDDLTDTPAELPTDAPAAAPADLAGDASLDSAAAADAAEAEARAEAGRAATGEVDAVPVADVASVPSLEQPLAEQPIAEQPVVRDTGDYAAPVQTVYVTAPEPPRRRGNRGLGTLFAVLATVVFAAAYAGITALLILLVRPEGVTDAVGTFVAGPLFYVPVITFLVIMVLWALLANRASWWAWVLGSLVIGAVVYFVSIGVLLLSAGGFSLTASAAAQTFSHLALNPALIIAGLLAREVSVWFGAAISARGRKVRERNYEAWQQYERDEAEKRAEFAGRSAV